MMPLTQIWRICASLSGCFIELSTMRRLDASFSTPGYTYSLM